MSTLVLPLNSAHSCALQYTAVFRQIDINADGFISQIEFIKALRRDAALAHKLGLPRNAKQSCTQKYEQD
jgi:hypothetical protein